MDEIAKPTVARDDMGPIAYDVVQNGDPMAVYVITGVIFVIMAIWLLRMLYQMFKSIYVASKLKSVGSTFLEKAIEKNDVYVIQFAFTDFGYRVNEKLTKGRTPIMVAVKANNIEQVKIFSKMGADRTLKDHDGKTVYDYAKESSSDEIHRFFNLSRKTKAKS